MKEAPQIVKMNICLSNDIRLTLEGAGVIQAYCRDNRIGDKPFVAMLKEAVADADPVVLGNYAIKAKLKREIPLAADDIRVKEAIVDWIKSVSISAISSASNSWHREESLYDLMLALCVKMRGDRRVPFRRRGLSASRLGMRRKWRLLLPVSRRLRRPPSRI